MTDTWWDSPEWKAYEAAGSYPSRVEELEQATWQTRVIDLSVSEAELWGGIRKSYKSLIHRAERAYTIAEWRPGVMCYARAIHDREARRATRSGETWDMMADWIDGGHALLVGASSSVGKLDWVVVRSPCAYAYFIIANRWAYYASAASLESNVNHALIWHGMKALKARGVRWLEMGWQGHDHSEKGRAIEFLKRGFGGFDMPAKDAPLLAFREAA